MLMTKGAAHAQVHEEARVTSRDQGLLKITKEGTTKRPKRASILLEPEELVSL